MTLQFVLRIREDCHAVRTANGARTPRPVGRSLCRALGAAERREHPWCWWRPRSPANSANRRTASSPAAAGAAEFGSAVAACSPRAYGDDPADPRGVGRRARMSDIKIDPQWIGLGVAAVGAGLGWILIWRAYQRARRRKALLARPGCAWPTPPPTRCRYRTAWGGVHIHIDHLLLTPRGVLLLDTRRVGRTHIRRRSDE